MRFKDLSTVLLTCLAYHTALAHEHDETDAYPEPFVGWTQEDLDAKWGTDVGSPPLTNQVID